MHLDRLSLHHFRNFQGGEIEFDPGVNLLTGPNGQGKTNLLEAIHFACLAHSQRTSRDRELIQWGQAAFVLRVEGFSRGEPRAQSVEYAEDGGRRVKVDGRESRRLSDLLGGFAVVALGPEDLAIVSGPPQARRRFLDSLLCQYSPAYLEQLRRYQHALKQRNSLLRQGDRYPADLFTVYTDQLAEAGAKVQAARLAFLDRLGPAAAGTYARIAPDGEAFSLGLSCGFSAAREEAGIRADLIAKLASQAAQERDARATLFGPHRDDLLFFLSGKSLRDFGSQGQKRSAALSLKLASARLLEEEGGYPPILLLDDVFAELDEARRMQLSALIDRKGQVFLANPRQADLPFEVRKVFRVRAGEVA